MLGKINKYKQLISNASVARPPFDETRSDTVPFVSSPLRSSFPCRVCHFRLSQNRGSVH